MNLLVLQPALRNLAYSCFPTGQREARWSGQVGPGPDGAMARVEEECRARGGFEPHVLALRVPYGGAAFAEPVLADDSTAARLRALSAEAPLHIPHVLSTLKACGHVYPDRPVVLVFETSFFTRLPAREHHYGLDPQLSEELGLRRYGFHGLLHEAACERAGRHPAAAGNPPSRILSICLEPRPEVAAVLGLQPLTTTSGATPLEGIPGETTCGDLDPSIVLSLSRERKWGPEQIDKVLTRESGLRALAGRAVTVSQVLQAKAPDIEQARDVLRYRILLACGAGIAALGGLDVIVFSGRYASAGKELGPWLEAKLKAARATERPVPFHIFPDPVDRVIADLAVATLLRREEVVEEV